MERKFSVEELEEKYGLPYEDAISFKRADKHRWYTVCEVVFQADDGLFYMVDYLEPASENQEGQDRWWNDPMSATQVEKVPVQTYKWVPVEH